MSEAARLAGRAALLGLIVVSAPWPAPRAGARAGQQAVAIVCSLSGSVRVDQPGARGGKHAARVFERLPAGARIELRRGARVAVAFAGGRRYEIVGPAAAVTARDGLRRLRGRVRELPAVEPWATLLALDPEERPGAVAGAVRIRGPARELQPAGGERTLADRTVLRIKPRAPGESLRVMVRDEHGGTVVEETTRGDRIPIPAHRLRAGARYVWWAEPEDAGREPSRPGAQFETLPAELSAARDRLVRSVGERDDPEALALCVALDRDLRLLEEARAGLLQIVRRCPTCTVHRRELLELEVRMGLRPAEQGLPR